MGEGNGKGAADRSRDGKFAPGNSLAFKKGETRNPTGYNARNRHALTDTLSAMMNDNVEVYDANGIKTGTVPRHVAIARWLMNAAFPPLGKIDPRLAGIHKAALEAVLARVDPTASVNGKGSAQLDILIRSGARPEFVDAVVEQCDGPNLTPKAVLGALRSLPPAKTNGKTQR